MNIHQAGHVKHSTTSEFRCVIRRSTGQASFTSGMWEFMRLALTNTMQFLPQFLMGHLHTPFFAEFPTRLRVFEVHLTPGNDRRLRVMFVSPPFDWFPFPRPATTAPLPNHHTTKTNGGFRGDECTRVLFPGLVLFAFQIFFLLGSALVKVLHRAEGSTFGGNPQKFRSFFFDRFHGFSNPFPRREIAAVPPRQSLGGESLFFGFLRQYRMFRAGQL